MMLGCAGVVPTPPPSPPRVEPNAALETLKAGCHLDETRGEWLCTGEAISAAGHGLIDAAADIREVRLDAEQSKRLAGIDRAEMAGQLWDMTQDRDHLATMRWVWGAVGVAAGALAAGLCAGLIAR